VILAASCLAKPRPQQARLNCMLIAAIVAVIPRNG
jgi:hypothetical protein